MAKLQYRTISKRTVDGLSVDEKDAVFWDRELPDFGVGMYSSGSKVCVVQTRAQGESKRVTLGRHGVISADQALGICSQPFSAGLPAAHISRTRFLRMCHSYYSPVYQAN